MIKKLLLTCLILPASSLTLFSQNLKIADTIIYTVPSGWTYLDASSKQIPNRGKITHAKFENPSTNQKLTVSVLKVDHPSSSVAYSDELIESTFAPWIDAAREQGMHPNPGRSLARDNFIFYSQPLKQSKYSKLELRGVLMQAGDDWVNFFCTGPEQVSWQQYKQLIIGTQVVAATSN